MAWSKKVGKSGGIKVVIFKFTWRMKHNYAILWLLIIEWKSCKWINLLDLVVIYNRGTNCLNKKCKDQIDTYII